MITSWSPSRLNDYETCPAKAKYKYVDKLPEPPAEALARGTRYHKMAEDFILGTAKRPPTELARVSRELTRLQKRHKRGLVQVEQALAFNADWKPVDWFSKDVWLRCKIDVVDTTPPVPRKAGIIVQRAVVIDWKTGKNNERDADKHSDQLNLYATAVLSKGIAQKVRAKLVFTDLGEEVNKAAGTMEMEDLLDAQVKWETRVEPMMEDKDFFPTPNFTCRWCAFSKSKGGPCRF